MLCNECDKKDICSELCPDAEEYVNQDYVPRTEKTIPLSSLDKLPFGIRTWSDSPEKSIFSKREQQVIGAIVRGMTRQEIAEHLGITMKNLREIIRRMRKRATKLYIK